MEAAKPKCFSRSMLKVTKVSQIYKFFFLDELKVFNVKLIMPPITADVKI